MVLLDSNVLMLGKIAIDGFRLTNVNINPCPYWILASMGGLGKIQRLIKHEIVIQINPNKPTYNIIIQDVTSYDILVGGVVLYPLGITIDFW